MDSVVRLTHIILPVKDQPSQELPERGPAQVDRLLVALHAVETEPGEPGELERDPVAPLVQPVFMFRKSATVLLEPPSELKLQGAMLCHQRAAEVFSAAPVDVDLPNGR